MFPGQTRIERGGAPQPGELRRGQPPLDLRGQAEHERARRDARPLGHQRSGADQALRADTAFQHDGAHPDKAAVADARAVDDGAMAHRDPAPDAGRPPVIRVHDRQVLDVAARAHRNSGHISAQDGQGPDRRLRAQSDTTDDLRAIVHECGGMDLRLARPERANHLIDFSIPTRSSQNPIQA